MYVQVRLNSIAFTFYFPLNFRLGKVYSRYWLHNGFVNIDNEKMSKSLKNFKTLRYTHE